MTVGTPVDAGPAARRLPAWCWPVVPVALAVGAAATLLLPWWRPEAGPVLLGAGPRRELAPDTWAGIEIAGPGGVLAAALAGVAVVAVVLRACRRRAVPATVTRAAAASAGVAAAVCGAAALVDRGPTGAPGVWACVGAGLAAAGSAALLRTSRPCTQRVLATALLAAAATVALPDGAPPPAGATVGPFVRIAALGEWPLRSGAPGLAGTLDDARPVVVDGAPGVVTSSGIIVADATGRAWVLARTDRGAPPPLGVAGDRVVHWISADTLAVTGLRADDPVRVVVRGVGAASPLGADGSVWLHSDIDPPETVRRLDLAAYDGRQDLPAVYLPVVTVQNPSGETPLDVRGVLPVPGGALRVAAPVPQLQLLTGTSAGIAVSPVAGATVLCDQVGGGAGVRAVAADAAGVWFPASGPHGDHLVHLDPAGTRQVVATPLPGHVAALLAPGDGSLLLTVRDGEGSALWRLDEARATLTDPPPACAATG